MPHREHFSILVIEDNEGDFILIEEFLLAQFEDAAIKHCKNYTTAKKVLTDHADQFNVILLDLSLPDKHGVDLIKEVVSFGVTVPIIVLTGYIDFEFGVKSLSLGVSDYLLKEELTALSLYKSIIYNVERKKITATLEESEKRVRTFAKQLSDVVEEERSRIAREIHDEFGQQLSGLKMSLTSLKRFSEPGNDIASVIDALLLDINQSISTIRQIANELRPALLDKLGLFAAIEWLLNQFQQKSGMDTRIYIDIDQPPIDKSIEINIFRIFQEVLTNIYKHANATLVNIRIENRDGVINMKIIDNGRGIKSSTLHNPMSMGLLNMKERAILIGAELNISSADNSGTTVELIFDVNQKQTLESKRVIYN